jgi:N-acylglucosamine 2-epimerase/mannose-6-phosphate isomerase
LVEPGHQFEWAWILQQYQAVSSVDVADAAKRLTDFAERTGVSTEGLTWRSVRDDGVALDRGSRVWPNTERIKAAVAMCRLFGQDPEPWFQQSTDVLLKRFFRPAPSGAWIDAIDEAGAPAVDKIPASSLYHVFLAFAEMQQVRRAARPG